MSEQNDPALAQSKSSALAIRSPTDAAAFWALPIAPVDLLLDALDLPKSSFYLIKDDVGFKTFKLGRRLYCRPQEAREAIEAFSARPT